MNKRKRTQKNPSGFTIIEVILFFAVSSALMLGIITGITRSISRQRYNDTVNDFAEYIRGIYSDVQAVANSEKTFASPTPEGGRSDQAIYGKLLIFSGKTVQSYTLSGIALSSSFIRIDDLSCSGSDTLALLDCTKTHSLGDEGSYTLIWDGKVQTTASASSGADFSGCMLVVRSPLSGSVQTYYASSCTEPDETTVEAIPNYYELGFSSNDIDFCVQSDDNTNKRRRNVRVKENASNSSGVVIPELDSNVASDPSGNRCLE